jgi:hypothetical protein
MLSALLCYWINHPGKKWVNWLLGMAFLVTMALPLMGLLTHH